VLIALSRLENLRIGTTCQTDDDMTINSLLIFLMYVHIISVLVRGMSICNYHVHLANFNATQHSIHLLTHSMIMCHEEKKTTEESITTKGTQILHKNK
jgi:hypothetical protein